MSPRTPRKADWKTARKILPSVASHKLPWLWWNGHWLLALPSRPLWPTAFTATIANSWRHCGNAGCLEAEADTRALLEAAGGRGAGRTLTAAREVVAAAPDPDQVLTRFLRSTFAAAADLGDWNCR